MGKNANQVILPLCLKPDRFLGGHVQAPHMVWVGCGALRIAGDRARGVKPTLLQAETATGAGSTAARRHLWCERAEGICKNLVRTVIQPWLSPWHMGRWDIASIALVEESISGCWLCTYRQLPTICLPDAIWLAGIKLPQKPPQLAFQCREVFKIHVFGELCTHM